MAHWKEAQNRTGLVSVTPLAHNLLARTQGGSSATKDDFTYESRQQEPPKTSFATSRYASHVKTYPRVAGGLDVQPNLTGQQAGIETRFVPLEANVRRATVTHEEFIEQKIVRMDGYMLDSANFPNNTDAYKEVHEAALRLIYTLGPQHVLRLEIHYNARLRRNRYGAQYLDGIVLTLTEDAPIYLLDIDYGTCATYTVCENDGLEVRFGDSISPKHAKIMRNKLISTHLRDKRFDKKTARGTHLDENEVVPCDNYFMQWKDRKQTRIDQQNSLASKAYNSMFSICEGTMQADGEQTGIYGYNHDPDCASTLRKETRKHKLTVSQIYRSEMYTTSMKESAATTAAMVKELADAAGLIVPTYEFNYQDKSEGEFVLQIADLTYYAPTTFIAPIIIDAPVTDTTRQVGAYNVHINVFADYANCVPRFTIARPGALMSDAMPIESRMEDNSHVGYVFSHGPRASVTLLRPIFHEESHGLERQWYPKLWRMARESGLILSQSEKVALEARGAAGMRAITLTARKPTAHFPIGGIYIGEKVGAKMELSDVTLVAGLTSPGMVSENYVSFGRTRDATLKNKLDMTQKQLENEAAMDGYGIEKVFLGNVQFLYAGCFNAAMVNLPTIVNCVSAYAYVPIPLSNTTVRNQIMLLCGNFYTAAMKNNPSVAPRKRVDAEIAKISNLEAHLDADVKRTYDNDDDELLVVLTKGMTYLYDGNLMCIKSWLKYCYRYLNPANMEEFKGAKIDPPFTLRAALDTIRQGEYTDQPMEYSPPSSTSW